MGKRFVSFSDIKGFRHVVNSVNHQAEFEGMDENDKPIMNPNNPKPTIQFTGTVKIHGTNAGIGWDGKELWAQSRSDIITVEKDNMGFAFFVEGNKDLLIDFMKDIKDKYDIKDDETIIVYGEWCGKGIQKGVGVTELDKMFVIFKIKVAGLDPKANTWLDYNYKKLFTMTRNNIHFIQQYGVYALDVDFEKPEEAQNKLIEFTNNVEKECPVAKQHGVSGIGEGVVWSASYKGNSYVFKVKGEKHSVTKTKKLAPIDIEKVNNIKEFVEYAVTEGRLEQAVDAVFTSQGKEIEKKGIGGFLKWVQGDVIKEELDTLVKNGLEPKEVNGAVSKKAMKWLMAKYML